MSNWRRQSTSACTGTTSPETVVPGSMTVIACGFCVDLDQRQQVRCRPSGIRSVSPSEAATSNGSAGWCVLARRRRSRRKPHAQAMSARQRRAAHPRHEQQGDGKTDGAALPGRARPGTARNTTPDGHDGLEHEQIDERQEPLRADADGGA